MNEWAKEKMPLLLPPYKFYLLKGVGCVCVWQRQVVRDRIWDPKTAAWEREGGRNSVWILRLQRGWQWWGGSTTTCRIEVRRAQPLPQAWRVSLPSLTRQCERFWQAPIIPSLSQMVGSGIDIPKALKSSQMLCCHSLNNRGRNKGGKNWCWLLILLMLLKTAPMLQFWNRSPLPLKACCVIDCHLSPASRRASWQLSAKASDLHVFFWHLTNGNSLQICINSLCLTNNQGLHSVDAGNISSDTKEWEAGGWGAGGWQKTSQQITDVLTKRWM